jgi:serine/threonine protein kinase
MNRYILEEEQIGEGSFGNVYRATKKKQGNSGKRKYYAVKKLKETFSSWDEVINKREYHAIVAFMSTDKNIHTDKEKEEEIRDGINHLVRVYEILREQDSCLYFVMEYMKDGNLQDFIQSKTESRRPIIITTATTTTTTVNASQNPTMEESEIRSILYQTFTALRHVHYLGYVHRDIKPENIMLHGRTVKLGDFSLARTYHRYGNNSKQGGEATSTAIRQHKTSSTIMMTDYVGTRWYRAPEILIGHLSNSNNNNHKSIDPVDEHDNYCCYTETVDIFAMGLVAAELYRCFPLFHGRDNTEQLKLIRDMLFVGNNDDDEILFFEQQKENDVVIDRLAHVIPTADSRAVSFIRDLLYFRPERRPSTREILRHTYFNSFQKQQSQHSNHHQHHHHHQRNKQLQQSSLGGVVNRESVSVTNEEFDKDREIVHILDTGRKQFHERNSKTSLSPLTPRGLFPTSSMAGQRINKEQSTMTRTVDKAAKTITPATAGMTSSLKRKQTPNIRVSQIFNID